VFGKLFCKSAFEKKKKSSIIMFGKLLCKTDVKKKPIFQSWVLQLLVFGFFSSKTVKKS